MSLLRSLSRTKRIEQSIADAAEPGHQRKRSLSAFDLMILGVAVAVGAGIFVAWLAVGIAIYFAYGRRHSRVGIAARAAGN